MSYFAGMRLSDYALGFVATAIAVTLLIAPFLWLWTTRGMPIEGWIGVLYLLMISVAVAAILPAQIIKYHRQCASSAIV